jgi:ABC-type spermidine/putrescine transport system permease subunit II
MAEAAPPPRRRDVPRVAYTIFVWLLFGLLVLGPLLTIVALSFVPSVYAPRQLPTIHWYARLFTEPALYAPLVRSLQIALMVTTIQLFFGSLLAFAIARNQIFGARHLDAMSNITIALPSVVVGLALLAYYGPFGPIAALGDLMYGNPWTLTWTLWIVVLAHVLETFPYMVRSATTGLGKLNPQLESAARSLGAGRWRTFHTITLPQLRSSLVAGSVLVFSRSIAEFGATIVVVSAALRTAPIRIYAEAEPGALELASAYSVVLMIVSFVAYTLMRRWLLRRELEAGPAGLA